METLREKKKKPRELMQEIQYSTGMNTVRKKKTKKKRTLSKWRRKRRHVSKLMRNLTLILKNSQHQTEHMNKDPHSDTWFQSFRALRIRTMSKKFPKITRLKQTWGPGGLHSNPCPHTWQLYDLRPSLSRAQFLHLQNGDHGSIGRLLWGGKELI